MSSHSGTWNSWRGDASTGSLRFRFARGRCGEGGAGADFDLGTLISLRVHDEVDVSLNLPFS